VFILAAKRSFGCSRIVAPAVGVEVLTLSDKTLRPALWIFLESAPPYRARLTCRPNVSRSYKYCERLAWTQTNALAHRHSSRFFKIADE